MSTPARRWGEMTWQDLQEADLSRWVAVLPVAAIEQHGPHLPLSTDADIMAGYIAYTDAALPREVPATFLPVQTIGVSPEHRDFPGTLSFSPETALRAWTEIGDSLARAGLRRLILVSSHGGNNGLLDVIARDLRIRHSMLAVTTSFARFGYPDGLFPTQEIAHGVHGGEIETSLMLAFQPELVRMFEASDFTPETLRMEREFKHLRAGRPAGFGWLAQDMNSEGVLGNAANASAEKGHAAAAFGAKAFAELIADVAAFPLERLKAGPLG